MSERRKKVHANEKASGVEPPSAHVMSQELLFTKAKLSIAAQTAAFKVKAFYFGLTGPFPV